MQTTTGRALRLVPGLPIAMQKICVAAFNAAKMRAVRHTVKLDPASAAGLCVQMAGGPKEALARIEGGDDWTVLVRNHLRQMVKDEEREP